MGEVNKRGQEYWGFHLGRRSIEEDKLAAGRDEIYLSLVVLAGRNELTGGGWNPSGSVNDK